MAVSSSASGEAGISQCQSPRRGFHERQILARTLQFLSVLNFHHCYLSVWLPLPRRKRFFRIERKLGQDFRTIPASPQANSWMDNHKLELMSPLHSFWRWWYSVRNKTRCNKQHLNNKNNQKAETSNTSGWGPPMGISLSRPHKEV